jgi:catechol 2,3-dioxygenase-like lactoylglutathione lyase family enzyme
MLLGWPRDAPAARAGPPKEGDGWSHGLRTSSITACHSVSDVARAAAFYRDMLGLTVTHLKAGAGFSLMPWAELQVGGLTVALVGTSGASAAEIDLTSPWPEHRWAVERPLYFEPPRGEQRGGRPSCWPSKTCGPPSRSAAPRASRSSAPCAAPETRHRHRDDSPVTTAPEVVLVSRRVRPVGRPRPARVGGISRGAARHPAGHYTARAAC